jgi:hypothetical protein
MLPLLGSIHAGESGGEHIGLIIYYIYLANTGLLIYM